MDDIERKGGIGCNCCNLLMHLRAKLRVNMGRGEGVMWEGGHFDEM